jgi:superfamily II DNA/RNA helicase
MLFSATMPGPIVTLARRFMSKPIHIRATDPDEGLTQANIEHIVYRAHSLDKDEVIARILQAEGRGKTVIFTRTKRAAARLVEELADRGFPAAAVHGDMSQEAREKSMASFKAGKKEILIATDVAARGIDVDDVTHVINHTIPEDDKAYLHRVGRTGRAGKTGIAVTFVDWDDLHKWALINRALEFGKPEPQETYSSSEHLFADLNIPVGAKGRLRSTPAAKGTDRGGAPSSRAGGSRDGGSHDSRGGSRGGQTRSGNAAGSERRVNNPPRHVTPEGTPEQAGGTHDGGGSEHHNGNNPSRSRNRTRRRGPGLASS